MAESTSTSEVFDAGKQQLGLTYAKGLLGAAGKAGQTATVLDELESLVRDVLPKVRSLNAAISSPRLSIEEKTAILDKAFAGKMAPLLLTFLKVVAQHNRLDCLAAMATAARKLHNEQTGRVEVLVQTAAPISNPLRERLAARLGEMLGKQVDLKATLNPELLGGLVVRVGDTLFDGSLISKLNKMRKSALAGATLAVRDSLDKFATT